MGSRLSRIWTRSSNSDHNMSTERVGLDDEDPLAMAYLAYVLRSGYRRYNFPSANSSDSDEENNVIRESEANTRLNVPHPNTVQESDLCQRVLLNQGISYGRTTKKCSSTTVKLRQRETGCCGKPLRSSFSLGTCTLLSSQCIPNHVSQEMQFREKVFCGIYSDDGNTFLSACQDRHIRVYNTKNKLEGSRPFKDILAQDVGWSVLDVGFSSDSRHLAYSSWSNCIHLCSVFDGEDPNLVKHTPLNLHPEDYNFAVFSLQFTKDNNEILCGSNNGYLYVYNLEANRRTLKVEDAHEDDVNAICFADDCSQIIYSGGDDGLVQVWDRRMLSESSNSPVGTLAGHQDGITFIDTIGDARYLLSNSKDQSIKLWDIRKFSSNDAIDNVRQVVSQQAWDYRWQAVPRGVRRKCKLTVSGDTSVMTYTGHTVLNTLIRARFSPISSTGNKYIYCGCSTGNVFIYDILTGDVVSKLEAHSQCVRDVAWHPYKQELISSSWDGTVKVWDFKRSN